MDGFGLLRVHLVRPIGYCTGMTPLSSIERDLLVQIEPAPGRRPIKFKIGGLAGALAAARQAGCADADFKAARGPRS